MRRRARASLELPVELRNQVVRLEIEGETGAGGVVLLDERFRRRPVGLLPAQEESADAPLIGELFYLDRALAPFVELRRGALDQLLAPPDRRAGAGRPAGGGRARSASALTRWVERGGTLIRFAGPRVAERPDPLLPVPLRAGERQLGGALSWEQPQRLAPFPENSPFPGLAVPEEVTVERQVLAEPSPRPDRRAPGRGWPTARRWSPPSRAARAGIVLFHVTANADWSNLPLSGLFVQMLRRIVALSAGVAGNEGDAPLAPLEVLDGFGRLGAAPPARRRRWPPRRSRRRCPRPRHPPGWYGTAGAGRRECRLPARRSTSAAPFRRRAPRRRRRRAPRLLAIGGMPAERDLGALAAGRGAAAAGRRPADRAGAARPAAVPPAGRAGAAACWRRAGPAPAQGAAQGRAGDRWRSRALATRLAYVVTGDPRWTRPSAWAWSGCPDFVNRRTAAALADPAAVTPGQDDLSFFPLLYWPVMPDAPQPGAPAVTALNDFMRHGGIILFDTRDEGCRRGLRGRRPRRRCGG